MDVEKLYTPILPIPLLVYNYLILNDKIKWREICSIKSLADISAMLYERKGSNMTKLLRLALACLIFTSGTAQATLFNFSYQFGSGDQITGSLTGTLSGAYVTGASNINVFFNGVAFNGNGALFATAYVPGVGWDNTIAAPISTDPLLNNFLFIDVYDPPPSDWTNYFQMINGDTFSYVSASNGIINPYDFNIFSPTWSLTAVTAVSEPGTIALMGLALLVAGVSRKRRG